MRVLVVMPGLTHDAGAERSFLAMAPGLVDRGLDLHLALFTDRQEPVADLRRIGVTAHDLSASHNPLSRAAKLRRLIRSVRPDVVHASLWEASLPAQLAVIGTGVPVVVSWTGMSYSPQRFAELGASAWKLRLVQVLDAAVGRVSRARYHAVTEGVARVNARNLRVNPTRVMVGERGRDARQFAPEPAEAEAVRQTLGLSSGAQVVLALGRQDAVKGYDSLLDAFDRVADACPAAVLLVGGREGLATPALTAQRALLRNADAVRFLGQRNDVPALLALADVIVCSSTREGAAGALIEAMAVGTPIVSVPLEGLEGVLTDGRNAVVVGRSRLAEGILSVLQSDELARRLSVGATATFAERFTVERSVERLIEILEAAAADS